MLRPGHLQGKIAESCTVDYATTIDKLRYKNVNLYLINRLFGWFEGYSLDRIKMTEWIWTNHDKDKLWKLNLTEIETDKPIETDEP